MIKIDFVLPWVNPNDVEWQKSKHIHSNKSESFIENNSSFRYRDFDTLKYVLRSIEL
ncbi:TPA: Stealth CR1 domain-containing protein, partial [Morganella morganii subsp. morganii]|nr:Stealth CR1 domain-containing protein [Morganella morganii subsp. morganii]